MEHLAQIIFRVMHDHVAVSSNKPLRLWDTQVVHEFSIVRFPFLFHYEVPQHVVGDVLFWCLLLSMELQIVDVVSNGLSSFRVRKPDPINELSQKLRPDEANAVTDRAVP